MNKKIDLEKLTIKDIKLKIDNIFGNIGFKEIGLLFDYKGPEVEFFKAQILVEGLKDFHITTKPNISEEEKRECVKETIRIWNIKGKPIFEL